MEIIKKYWWIPVLVLVTGVVLAVIATEKAKIQSTANQNTVCYDLPTDKGISEIGSKYWFALHDIANRIPCSLCRDKATGFMKFFHDLVNKKLDKPLYDKANFDQWVQIINTMTITPPKA